MVELQKSKNENEVSKLGSIIKDLAEKYELSGAFTHYNDGRDKIDYSSEID